MTLLGSRVATLALFIQALATMSVWVDSSDLETLVTSIAFFKLCCVCLPLCIGFVRIRLIARWRERGAIKQVCTVLHALFGCRGCRSECASFQSFLGVGLPWVMISRVWDSRMQVYSFVLCWTASTRASCVQTGW